MKWVLIHLCVDKRGYYYMFDLLVYSVILSYVSRTIPFYVSFLCIIFRGRKIMVILKRGGWRVVLCKNFFIYIVFLTILLYHLMINRSTLLLVFFCLVIDLFVLYHNLNFSCTYCLYWFSHNISLLYSDNQNDLFSFMSLNSYLS